MVIRGFAENMRFAFSDLIKKMLNFCITQTYYTLEAYQAMLWTLDFL